MVHKFKTMGRQPYEYRQQETTRYIFISVGKRELRKVVDFTLISKDTYNLSFGDLLPDGTIDDKANSNNGDIGKVLSTVIAILREFTSSYPQAEILFMGSTDLRMKLYIRILRTYHVSFIREFQIKAVISKGAGYLEVDFDPLADVEYRFILIKRII